MRDWDSLALLGDNDQTHAQKISGQANYLKNAILNFHIPFSTQVHVPTNPMLLPFHKYRKIQTKEMLYQRDETHIYIYFTATNNFIFTCFSTH